VDDDKLPPPPDRDAPVPEVTVSVAGEQDLGELLELMRGYCDFYEVSPSDDALLALSRMLIADPEREGLQLIARGDGGEAVGFATLYWSWSTSHAARLGTMNDLFVVPRSRGLRVGERLIEACLERCAEHGAEQMEWQTGLDNRPGQALYDRVGGRREPWLSYSLDVPRR
jgi:GNAT superfamily N-acetyltransferase